MSSASVVDIERSPAAGEVVLPSLSLRHNFSWTLLGNGLYAACQWAIVVVLAKLGTPEMVGKFTFALSLTAPVILLANLNLRRLQATDARHEYEFGEYLGLQ